MCNSDKRAILGVFFSTGCEGGCGWALGGRLARNSSKGADSSTMKLSREQFLAEMYRQLKKFGRLPRLHGESDDAQAVERMHQLMEIKGLPKGLELNAHRRCFSTNEQDRHDVGRSLQSEGRTVDPMLQKRALQPLASIRPFTFP